MGLKRGKTVREERVRWDFLEGWEIISPWEYLSILTDSLEHFGYFLQLPRAKKWSSKVAFFN